MYLENNTCKTFILIFSLLFYIPASNSIFAAPVSVKVKELAAETYTTTGNSSQDGTSEVVQQIGSFFSTGQFISNSSFTQSAGFFRIDPVTLTTINGKPITTLEYWVSTSQFPGVDISNFHRSAETYSVGGVPYVILSAGASSSSGTPTVNISATSNASISTQTNGEFLIALDSATNKNIKVTYKIKGTAKNGKDYSKIKKTTKILAGNVSEMIEITPKSKARVVRSVIITLLKPANKKLYKLGQKTSATVEINN